MPLRQEALVVEEGETARVLVMRSSACTGDCKSCGGCREERPVYADADNPIGARRGETVYVETATGVVLLSAVLVYLLPLVLFLIVYFIAQNLGAARSVSALIAAGAAVVSLTGAKYYNGKRAEKPACTIVSRIENEGDR